LPHSSNSERKKATSFWPAPRYVEHIDLDGARTIEALCDEAGIACRVFGEWTQRLVTTRIAERPDDDAITVGVLDDNAAEIVVPPRSTRDACTIARYALCALAYALFDLVARESVRDEPWTQMEIPEDGRAASASVLPGEI